MVKKIKSALELAMDRTASLKDGEHSEPGEEFESYYKAAALLAKSFLEQPAALDKSAETINGYPQGAKEKAARIFLENITGAAGPADSLHVAAAYRKLHPGGAAKAVEAAEALGREYDKKIAELQSRATGEPLRTELLEPLHRAGFSGSALASVNLERSQPWRDQLKKLAEEYEHQLADLKAELLAALIK